MAGTKISVDTQEDYALSCAVYDFLYPQNRLFGARAIARLFARRPWLRWINARSYQKQALFTKAQEFREAKKLLSLYGFPRVVRALRSR